MKKDNNKEERALNISRPAGLSYLLTVIRSSGAQQGCIKRDFNRVHRHSSFKVIKASPKKEK